MEEIYVSLEAVNAFDEFMKKECYCGTFEAKGCMLRDLTEKYEVEDDNEILHMLNQWFIQNKEYITARQRNELLDGFGA